MSRFDASIVIPLFNKVEYTLKCLAALAANTPADRYEVVLVDNGSSDETPALLDQLEGDVQIIRNAQNLGFSAACNQGAEAARGRHLLFLNNDTEPLPGWFEPLIGVLDREPDVGAVGAKLLFPDSTLQHAGVEVLEIRGKAPVVAIHRHYRKPADFPAANERCDLDVVTAACMAIRREAFDGAGRFDTGYWNGYEDVDLCFTIREAGWRIVYVPSSTLIHHESVSGPERFRRVDDNVRRLQDRWTGRVRPTVLGLETGASRPHPSRCRVHVLITGPSTTSLDVDRTWSSLERNLHPGDTMTIDPELARDLLPSSTPHPVGPPSPEADWVLEITAGAVADRNLVDHLMTAAFIRDVVEIGPATNVAGEQHWNEWARGDSRGVGARAARLAARVNEIHGVTQLIEGCVLRRVDPGGIARPLRVVAPSAYVELPRALTRVASQVDQ